jgi:hypothetical protein
MILKICPFLGVLSRRKYLLLPESFTVSWLTLAVASSVANKMRNYSEIQFRASLTCEEEIENPKRDLQLSDYSLISSSVNTPV